MPYRLHDEGLYDNILMLRNSYAWCSVLFGRYLSLPSIRDPPGQMPSGGQVHELKMYFARCPKPLGNWGDIHKRHSMLSKKREEYTQTYHMCGGMFPTRCGIPSLLCRYRYFWKHHLLVWLKKTTLFLISTYLEIYFNECNEYEIAYTCSQGAKEPMYYRLPLTTGWELNMVPFCPGNMK